MTGALPDESLAAFSDFIGAYLGLYFPKVRWPELKKGLAGAALEFGFDDPEACVRWLMASDLSRGQIEALAGHLTVGETYFFRGDNCFEALAKVVLPGLIGLRRTSGKYLRIWCAGCCSGEEPYSIAILLDEMGLDPKEWHISILGTDVNPLFLRKAVKGTFSKWSFRNTTEAVRDKYFQRTGDGRFLLLPRIRTNVTFRYHNLAENSYPSLLTNTNAMDLILCRNVLMYFTAENQRRVVAKLRQCLVDGGRLLVSPSEVSDFLLSQFDAIDIHGLTVFQKGPEGSRQGDPEGIESEPFEKSSPAADAAAPAALVPIQSAAPPASAGEAASRDPLAEARKMANQGRLAEASDLCRKALAGDKCNPRSYYLLAVVLQEQGSLEEAEDALRNAIYLDQDFALAHIMLGNVKLRRGRMPGGTGRTR